MRRIGIWLLIVLCAATVWFAGAELERKSDQRTTADSLLYLPNGKHLRLMSLGQAPLLADLIYIWAIQYYSNYERADRYRYVEHVFGEVIAELDPHYVDAYWLGALILTVEAGDLDAGLRLLDKGIENNPDQWILPYLAAWESYRVGDYARAAGYFARAADVPGAPPAVLRMRAGMFSKAGDLSTALQLWREVLDDPRADPATTAIAERQVRDLTVRSHLHDLQAAVERFRNENGELPANLEQLLGTGYIQALPRDPDDREYVYDPLTGQVGSKAGRVLGGS